MFFFVVFPKVKTCRFKSCRAQEELLEAGVQRVCRGCEQSMQRVCEKNNKGAVELLKGYSEYVTPRITERKI